MGWSAAAERQAEHQIRYCEVPSPSGDRGDQDERCAWAWVSDEAATDGGLFFLVLDLGLLLCWPLLLGNCRQSRLPAPAA
jgi:hypothetical protein